MTALAVTAVVGACVAAAGSIYAGVSSYQAGKAQQEAANEAAAAAQVQGQIQAEAARQQAEAQAAEYERQARMEQARAGIEQIQGEQEAEKRSRQLAASVGSLYANYAGNGLLVDGNPSDTLGAALRTEVAEGQADISTIRDNAAMNVWTRESNANSLLTSAGNTRIAGVNAATAYIQSGKNEATSLVNQGKIAAMQGKSALVGSIFGATGGLMSSVGSTGLSYKAATK